MTPYRQRQMLQMELAGTRHLLATTSEDPLATPLLQSRIDEIEVRIRDLEQRPSIAPTVELFFTHGVALGSEGLEASFTSEVLNSYQNVLTNHYTAKHYGKPRGSGKRRRESESQLFLTALPRGSFGLQLSQIQTHDWIAADNVSKAMQDVSRLVEATVESDEAFEAALTTFDARVFKPLKRFIVVLHAGETEFRLVTGFHETTLNADQISVAHARVSAADTDEDIVQWPGVFGGVTTFSYKFDFRPDNGELIHGPIGEEVTEETATAWNEHYTQKRVKAELKVSTVISRAGKKKPTYELLDLEPLEPLAAPAAGEQK